MIVILINDSESNNLALAKLKQSYDVTHSFIYPNGKKLEPDEVAIVDLDAKGKLQKTSKKELCNFLVKNNLVKNQSFINLLASDIIDDNSVGVYAAALVYRIQQSGIYPIASFVEDLDYNTVFIEPISTTDENWKIWGLNESIKNHNFFKSKKEALWEGNDIIKWCKEKNTVKNITKITSGFPGSSAYVPL